MSSVSDNSRITVIVPVYNRETLLIRCLDSIAGQDYRPVRVVVVDNGSTDRTRQVAVEWGERHTSGDFEVVVTDEPERGASAARHRGFVTAFGESAGDDEPEPVSFFDSDDLMLPGMLKEVMNTFAGRPDTEVMVWRLSRRELDGNVVLTRAVAQDAPLEMHIVHSFMCTIGYALRAGALRRAGGWKTGMMEWDDWELGVRILLTDPRVTVSEKVLAEINCQSESITGTGFARKAGKWERVLDMVEELLAHSGRPDRDRLCRVVVYRRVILAAHYMREGHPELARPLLKRALASGLLTSWRRKLLKWAYRYTARGMRGAYTIVRPFI